MVPPMVASIHPNTFPSFETFTPCSDNIKLLFPLIPSHWAKLLFSYPDQAFVHNIIGIATYGARIGYRGPFQSISSHNHPSAIRIPSEIQVNLSDELKYGRVKQVSHLPPFYISSPLGAAPKKSNGIFTGWRRIHDLSFPSGLSVNDGIPKHYGSLKYQTLDDALRLIAKAGPGVQLHKRDLKDAFRKIPVSPYDYWLLLFQWMGIYYVDLFLPFGLSTSPFLFNLFAEALHWILESVYSQSLTHYLDDFLLIGGNDCTLFHSLCQYLGFEEKSSKSIDGNVVDFTGIELDSIRMEARLPSDKHQRALRAVNDTLRKGSVSFITLHSVLEFLSFCARVIPLGRPFLRNLFNFLNLISITAKHRHANRRLSAEAKRDLKWWLVLLNNWSGIRIIRHHRPSYFIYTDASGSKGIGGWWGPKAFSTRIPRRHRTKHINWKEAYAILFSLALWGNQLSGSSITFMCDNSSIVDAINNKSIRGPAINPLQLILLTAALHDIEINACWLSSEENWIADALSRFNLARLANFQLDKLFNLPRRQSGSPISLLKQKLLNFYGSSAEARPTPLSTLAYQHLKSKNLVDGNQTPSTDILPHPLRKNFSSQPTANFTWLPRHSNPPSSPVGSLCIPLMDGSSHCPNIGPSREDARPPSELRLVLDNSYGYPILICVALILILKVGLN